MVTTLVLVAASLAAYVAYRNVVDGIRQADVSHLLGKRPPQYSTAAMNILVIGSDSRAGTNGRFGSAQAIARTCPLTSRPDRFTGVRSLRPAARAGE